MITKLGKVVFLLLCIFIPFFVYGQDTIHDTDGSFMCIIYSDDSVIYMNLEERTMLADAYKVEYIHGNDSLAKHIRNAYAINHAGSHYHGRFLYCILFDNELNIKEIRTWGPSEQFIENIIKESLKEVKDGWTLKEGAKREWHIYIGIANRFY